VGQKLPPKPQPGAQPTKQGDGSKQVKRAVISSSEDEDGGAPPCQGILGQLARGAAMGNRKGRWQRAVAKLRARLCRCSPWGHRPSCGKEKPSCSSPLLCCLTLCRWPKSARALAQTAGRPPLAAALTRMRTLRQAATASERQQWWRLQRRGAACTAPGSWTGVC
jgi:hypothetical protein